VILAAAAAAPPYLTSINRLCLHKRRTTHQQLTSKYVAHKKEERIPCKRHEDVEGRKGIVPVILDVGTRWR